MLSCIILHITQHCYHFTLLSISLHDSSYHKCSGSINLFYVFNILNQIHIYVYQDCNSFAEVMNYIIYYHYYIFKLNLPYNHNNFKVHNGSPCGHLWPWWKCLCVSQNPSHTDPNEAPHRPPMAPRVAQVKESWLKGLRALRRILVHPLHVPLFPAQRKGGTKSLGLTI